MACYSIGLYIFGYLGERYELRKILAIGTFCNATTLFIFGCILPWTNCKSFTAYAFIWSLNGFSQSCGWPTVIGIMGNWFGMSGRGFILGVWSSCQSVGNIMGALMVNAFLTTGFEYSFLFVSVSLFMLSIMIWFSVVNRPEEVGLPPSDEKSEEDQEPIISQEETKVKVSFWAALLIPGVIEYALSYFALKLVNYSFFFWLPYYIHNKFHWDDTESNSVSTWFDVGGIIGGILGGIVSDLWGHRSPIVFSFVLLAVPSLIGFNNSPNNKVTVSNYRLLIRLRSWKLYRRINIRLIYTSCNTS